MDNPSPIQEHELEQARRHGGAALLATVALVLVIVGGLNWGLVGLFGFDLVAAVAGPTSPLARAIYVLIGLAALFCALRLPRWSRLG